MTSATALGRLLELAASAGPPALFLDFDGTLVELADTPDAVEPPPRLVPLLRELYDRLSGALAIVTGRPVARVDQFLAPLRLPVAGLHGFEVRASPDGVAHAPPSPALDPIRNGVADLSERWPGIEVEDKGTTLAIHFRAVPDAAPAVHALAAALIARSPAPLKLIEGKMVVEVLPRGRDKGIGIRELMGQGPYAGRLPVFLGDDVTDEAGFRAVNQLGGVSIRVGSPGVPTDATHWLPNVRSVHELLESLLVRLG
jgi:trehalose 6-phosphate phosphatase